MMTAQRRVLLVDDHPIVRAGLCQLISQEVDLVVVGEASSAREALQKIEQLTPDVAVVDISLEDISGIELTKKIKNRFPLVHVLILSMHDETIYAERALRAGAKGYIMKQEGTEKLVGGLRKILQGDVYVSSSVASTFLGRMSGTTTAHPRKILDKLSDRELEVFHLLGEGKGTRHIAEQLCLSVKTIETHREHIKEKLGIANAPELIRQAVRYVEGKSR